MRRMVLVAVIAGAFLAGTAFAQPQGGAARPGASTGSRLAQLENEVENLDDDVYDLQRDLDDLESRVRDVESEL